MRFPWTKRKRGTYRTAKQRAAEEQSNIDFMMLQAWKEDLRQHPEYLSQVSRQKFGMADVGEGESSFEEPDFLSKIHEVKDAKSSLDSVFGSGGVTGGFMGMLSDIIKQDKDGEVAKAVAGLINLITGKVAQPAQQTVREEHIQIPQPEPQQIAEPEPETPQEAMTLFGNHFLELEPEQAALELYENRDKSDDIRHIIWSYLSENSLDEIIELIPELISVPEYEFLTPFAQKLSTNRSKRWLALVIDEVNKLKTQ